MNALDSRKNPPSSLHALLSAVVPGLGQMFTRRGGRGIGILLGLLALGYLTAWTIAQRARFPDVVLSADVLFSIRTGEGTAFIGVFWQCLALLLLLNALVYLVGRYLLREMNAPATRTGTLLLLLVVALLLIQDRIMDLAATQEEQSQLYAVTAVFASAALAGLYLWQIRDAALLASGAEPPSLMSGILIGCIVVLLLGWNITGIDLEKAISEFSDTRIILSRIVWPWRTAFEYEEIAIESSAPVQAPCPPGASGPPVSEEVPGEAWVIVTPTCGELSRRDLASGSLALGTELTIVGGGYIPGATVEIFWQNPIGNAFRPRGVGETLITVDDQGRFETTLNIPEVAIPVTAVGDQVHALIIRQESGEVFTGKISRDMKLALEGILATIMIGLMATFFGVILAFPFSFLAARNLMVPISSPFYRISGSLLAIVPALWLALRGTGQIADLLGGLAAAPFQVALSGLISVVAAVFIGARAGSFTFGYVAQNFSALMGRFLSGLGFAVLGAGLGYYLGLGYSRGIRSIPLGEDVAMLTESRFAMAGAIILAAAAFLYGWINAYREVSIGMAVYTVTRTVMNVVRSIEPLIWAIIGTIWVGLGPFAGTIALTLHTIAALGKLYSESIESIDPGPIEALQATGANRLQTIVYAVIPQILPPFISFTIYRWDINVRMSTIIGAVGGGGIGFILIQWIRQFQYNAAGLAVWLIAITVATLDYVSSRIRERFV